MVPQEDTRGVGEDGMEVRHNRVWPEVEDSWPRLARTLSSEGCGESLGRVSWPVVLTSPSLEIQAVGALGMKNREVSAGF